MNSLVCVIFLIVVNLIAWFRLRVMSKNSKKVAILALLISNICGLLYLYLKI
jgi:hypothetical protein